VVSLDDEPEPPQPASIDTPITAAASKANPFFIIIVPPSVSFPVWEVIFKT
jgi:hypothetical protein